MSDSLLDEIEDLQEDIAEFFPTSASQVTYTRTGGVGGGSSVAEDETTVHTGRLTALSGEELIQAQKIHERAKWRWDYPASVDIDPQAVLTVGGVDYEVVWAPKDRTYEVTRIAYLTR